MGAGKWRGRLVYARIAQCAALVTAVSLAVLAPAGMAATLAKPVNGARRRSQTSPRDVRARTQLNGRSTRRLTQREEELVAGFSTQVAATKRGTTILDLTGGQPRDGPGQRLRPLQLRLEARPEYAHLLGERLRMWLEQAGATKTEVFEVLLATTEAFTNAVQHPQEATIHLVEITGSITDHTVSVSIPRLRNLEG